MTAPELKPCPFCGGEASISKDHDPDGSGAFYAVKCHKCRAKSSEIYAVETCNIHFTQVRDAWNSRADLAAVQPAQVRVKPLVWTGGERVAATGLMLRMEGIFLDRDKVAQFEQERADEILSLLEPQPDPRDEVIARLVEALEWQRDQPEAHPFMKLQADAALAAAKAVQHD